MCPFREPDNSVTRLEIAETLAIQRRAFDRSIENICRLAFDDAIGAELPGGFRAVAQQYAEAEVQLDGVRRLLAEALMERRGAGFVSATGLANAMRERFDANEKAAGLRRPAAEDADRALTAMAHARGAELVMALA